MELKKELQGGETENDNLIDKKTPSEQDMPIDYSNYNITELKKLRERHSSHTAAYRRINAAIQRKRDRRRTTIWDKFFR